MTALSQSGISEWFLTEPQWKLLRLYQATGPDRSTEDASELYSGYWRPLYAYLLGLGYKTHDAEDLVQAFFLRLITKQVVNRVDFPHGQLWGTFWCV